MKRLMYLSILLFVAMSISCSKQTASIDKCANPTFDPPAGTYTDAQEVSISCPTINSTIVYTTDGTNPNSESLVYTNPIPIDGNTLTTIKAQAFREGWEDSNVASATYNVTGTVAIPTFSPQGGYYGSDQIVTISCNTSDATIRYTTDGSEPTASSTTYTSPINVIAPNETTIKAKAYKNGWLDSETTVAIYMFRVANPVFSPIGGTYTTSQIVTITCATSAATILYTIDGTDPIATSATYNGAINVTTNMTIKAKAIKDGWNNSNVVSAGYFVFGEMMIRIAAGTFTMGRTVGSSTYTDELPTHSVTLTRPYYIGKYEVTQAEYSATMGSNPSQFNGTNNPVEKVSWYHTLVYCNKRSIAEGLTPVYSINGSTNPNTWGSVPSYSTSAWNNPVINWNASGYRLPTEAEWEYAARGGATTPDYVYSGSNDPQNYAWYSANASGATHQVGYKSANGLGLFDMSGNVSEWVWDWYSDTYYSVSPATDPTGPTSGTQRVHRGGSWFHGASQIRIAYRDWGSPENSTGKVYSNRLGFRVVRTAEM